jgi:hypothetical protein
MWQDHHHTAGAVISHPRVPRITIAPVAFLRVSFVDDTGPSLHLL